MPESKKRSFSSDLIPCGSLSKEIGTGSTPASYATKRKSYCVSKMTFFQDENRLGSQYVLKNMRYNNISKREIGLETDRRDLPVKNILDSGIFRFSV